MRIVIADELKINPKIFDEIGKLGDLKIYNDRPKNMQEILERIKEADIMTAKWTEITEEIVDKASKTLKYIIIPAVGYDRIHIEAARSKGISVINCPTHNAAAVANLVIAFIFDLTRQVTKADKFLRYGEWNQFGFPGIELEGRKLGLIGYGHIGKKVADLAQKFGMEINFTNSSSTDADIDNLLRGSEIISIHTPLTEKTRHLLDERRLRLMKKDSYLINTSRGAVIDQKALIKILRDGHLSGVALDVFENEPLIGVPTEEIKELANKDNVVTTSHIAFNTKEAWDRLGEELLANIKSCVEGKPINVVN